MAALLHLAALFWSRSFVVPPVEVPTISEPSDPIELFEVPLPSKPRGQVEGGGDPKATGNLALQPAGIEPKAAPARISRPRQAKTAPEPVSADAPPERAAMSNETILAALFPKSASDSPLPIAEPIPDPGREQNLANKVARAIARADSFGLGPGRGGGRGGPGSGWAIDQIPAITDPVQRVRILKEDTNLAAECADVDGVLFGIEIENPSLDPGRPPFDPLAGWKVLTKLSRVELRSGAIYSWLPKKWQGPDKIECDRGQTRMHKEACFSLWLWFEACFNVKQAGRYDFRAARLGCVLHPTLLRVDGRVVLANGARELPTGSPESYNVVSQGSVMLEPGLHRLRLLSHQTHLPNIDLQLFVTGPDGRERLWATDL